MGHWSGTNFAPPSFTAHSDFNQIILIYVENVPITINWRWFRMQFSFVRVTNMHDAKRINNNINGMCEIIINEETEGSIVKFGDLRHRDEVRKLLQKSDWKRLIVFFIKIEPWTRASYSRKKAAWNLVTFQRVVEMWGSFVSLSSNKHNDINSDCIVMRLLILTDRLKRIEETLELDCGEKSFLIRVQKF
ncbi:hypothetical protein ES319_A01G077600v1 [Gossypium barbadense]|uniref:DUF4283 domain-containing protein n=1 Tax=Gossypium barbadense TaxID=3634 RepID=A0A5J5WUI3_GOSBA|nr:hypothetical protein ES319_A01G077600v1 [Gossypium barbadense]